MKRLYLVPACLLLLAVSVAGQSYLAPSVGYKARDIFPAYDNFQAVDLQDSLLYGMDGDTIHCFHLGSGEPVRKYGKPADYVSFPSFISVSPDGKELWAGFTVIGNADDRIYRVEVESGDWHLEASLGGNIDLVWWNDSILVSGMNSTSWDAPGSIFVLDTSGQNTHRKIIETGGYAAGLAVDTLGNLYYGTSYPMDPNVLLRWDSTTISSILADAGTDTLRPGDATILSDLTAGTYDSHIDAGGNLLFNLNLYGADKVIARWDGTEGNGYNYDTLAIATGEYDWLGYIKSEGNIDSLPGFDGAIGFEGAIGLDGEGFITGSMGRNRLVVTGAGRPLADIRRDHSPVLARPIDIVSGQAYDSAISIDLVQYFTDPDDPDSSFSFEIIVNSDSLVTVPGIKGQHMVVDFRAGGQANIVVKAITAGLSVNGATVIGVRKRVYGDVIVSDFEKLDLEPESFWNGSDGSGGFISGLARFPNHYNSDFQSWEGWAYSNISDNATPGYGNQYSAITGSGVDTAISGGPNYALGFQFFSPAIITFTTGEDYFVNGFFITNSTYTTLSMEQGDNFTKKFGGADGNDPDWFKLTYWGMLDGEYTDSNEFYLADFRFEDNTKDYIIKTWQWVPMSCLGRVDSILLSLSSSDVGDWGMNTPAYFCMDNFSVFPNPVTSTDRQPGDLDGLIHVFPNPSDGRFRIFSKGDAYLDGHLDVRIYNLTGKLVFEDPLYRGGESIDISRQPAGTYIIRVRTEGGTAGKIIQTW
jgi:hypothetical protein